MTRDPTQGTRPRAITVGSALGIAAVAVLGLIWLWQAARGDVPLLTENQLAAAETLWKEQGPSNYALIIDVGGQRAGEIQLRVEDGRVVEFSRDGFTPTQPRTWQIWSVEGQFEMIRRELEIADDPVREANAPPGTRHILRGKFDASLGWVRQFRRATLGSGTGISWSVREFIPLPANR